MKSKKLYVVAAGSGGHILPALTLARRWLAQNPEGKVIFWGSTGQLDQKIVSTHSFLYEVINVNLLKMQDVKSGSKCGVVWRLLKMFTQLFCAFIKAFVRALKDRPEKIVSTGGIISIPVCLGCWFARVPIDVYELNIEPGKAVKFLSPFARNIFVVFEKTKTLGSKKFKNKCELTHYPVRFTQQVFNINKSEIVEQINKKYEQHFSLNKKTIFLLGGSQGSMLLSKVLKACLEENRNICEKVQVIHQTGQMVDFDAVTFYRNFYKNIGVPAVVFSYNENIQNFYLLSDLIICRAGAGTLFEIEFFRKRCIVVPLVAASTSHQVQNAEQMAIAHPDLFKVICQDKFDVNALTYEISFVIY